MRVGGRFAEAGRPAAAEEPLQAKPAEPSSPRSWWRSEFGGKDAQSSGLSESSAARSPPGALGSESKTPPPSNFCSGRRRGQGLAERRARDPEGFPRRQPVLGFRGRSGWRGGASRGRWGCRSLLSAPSLGSPGSAPRARGVRPGVGRGWLLTAHTRPGEGAGPGETAPAGRAHLDPPDRR